MLEQKLTPSRLTPTSKRPNREKKPEEGLRSTHKKNENFRGGHSAQKNLCCGAAGYTIFFPQWSGGTGTSVSGHTQPAYHSQLTN